MLIFLSENDVYKRLLSSKFISIVFIAGDVFGILMHPGRQAYIVHLPAAGSGAGEGNREMNKMGKWPFPGIDGPLGEADLEKMDIIQGGCGQTLNN